MKIAICDDEPACVDKLRAQLTAYCAAKRLTCDCQTFTDPLVFGESDLASYDVVFLDANMGQVDGITAAKALRAVNTAAIVCYVSAFVEYAPLGYRVDAFRYLMKHELDTGFADCMDEIVERLAMHSKRISIVTTAGQQPLAIASLVFLESFRHQILIHLADGTTLESRQHSLSELTALLSSHAFLRIHKSFLVNPAHIAAIKNRVVTLHSGQTLNCGKTDYADTLRAFTLWKGGI